jgi:hypothetical protein
MKLIKDSPGRHQNQPLSGPGWFAWCLALLFVSMTPLVAATSTWNGASTTDSYWSDAANWGGTAVASGNALSFGGTARQTDTNDVSGLSLASITMSTANWNVQGSNVTLNGNWTASVSGTSTWGLNTVLGVTPSITQSATADTLVLAGAISGTGGIIKTAGSGGQGAVQLQNTNNSFTGQVSIRSGQVVAYNLAVAGQNSSLGAATGPQAAIQIGITSTGYGGRLI